MGISIAHTASIALAVVLAGCTVPVLRPFRAHRGLGATGGITTLVSGKDAKNCDNEQGCVPGDSAGFSLLNVDGRYGFRSGALGLMVGGYTPGWFNQKSDKVYSGLVAYATGTVQDDAFSIGFSPEAGAETAGAAVGFDFQPLPLFGSRGHPALVAFSGYGRYLTPYRIESGPDDERNARVPSWDAGGGLRIAFVFVQYSYYAQSRGVIEYSVFETSNQASSWHTILIGFDLNRDILEATATISPKPDPPPEPPELTPQEQGCERLCGEQSTRRCGVAYTDCFNECRNRNVDLDCAEQDRALLFCQAKGLHCRDGQVTFPRCESEYDALQRCLPGRSRSR